MQARQDNQYKPSRHIFTSEAIELHQKYRHNFAACLRDSPTDRLLGF